MIRGLFRTILAVGLMTAAVSTAATASSLNPVQALPVELPAKPAAPLLAMPDLDGRIHDLAALSGRWVLVHFWASWCGPCVEELPSLDRLQKAMGNRLQVLAVNLGDSAEKARQTSQPLALNIPVLLDLDSSFGGFWQVQGLPTSYLVTPTGTIWGGVLGTRNWADPRMVEWLTQLTDQAASNLQHSPIQGINPVQPGDQDEQR